jgi:1-phosphofructokinase family hexose kinase
MRTLVVALNPSVDAEWRVDRVRWEEKNSLHSGHRWAGGKGINVARWLRRLRGNPLLLVPLGGATGAELAGYLRREKLAMAAVPIRGESRVNLILTTAAGRQLRFNPPGPRLTAKEWRAILKKAKGLLKRCDCLVLSGSLPPGAGRAAYAQLIRCAHRAGTRTVLDCDGAALKAGARARPFLTKPNRQELAEWHGTPLRSGAAVAGAARELSAVTRGWVLVSLGRRGALLVNRREGVELAADAPRIKAVNTVGAGDAMVAAVVRQLELGTPPEEWLRQGVAAGTAAAQCAAGTLPPRGLIERLVREITVKRRSI